MRHSVGGMIASGVQGNARGHLTRSRRAAEHRHDEQDVRLRRDEATAFRSEPPELVDPVPHPRGEAVEENARKSAEQEVLNAASARPR